MELPEPILFREEQRFRQPWLWGLIAAVVAVELVVALTLFREGALTAALAVLVLVALLPLLFALLRLRTEVRPDGLHLWFRPVFRHRHLPPHELIEATVRTYRPIVEYGGWGLRLGRRGTAYNVSGNRGVQLVLADGRRLLIGSQRADELAAAIDTLRPGDLR